MPPTTPSLAAANSQQDRDAYLKYHIQQGLLEAESAVPSPEVRAQQRGYLAQVPVGLYRGVVGGIARVPRALSAVPGLRGVTEPVAEAIESSLPAPSGGVLESGLESGAGSLTIAGLAGAALAAGGVLTPLAVAGTVGVTFMGSEYAESRKRLEGLNQALVEAGQAPLATEEITQIALTRGLIEGGFEALGSYIIGARFLGGAAARAVQAAILRKLPGVVGGACEKLAWLPWKKALRSL